MFSVISIHQQLTSWPSYSLQENVAPMEVNERMVLLMLHT
jgi:hypothetical protein